MTSPPAHELLDAAEIARHVERLGAEITADHPDGVVLIAVLKGALVFVADLARAIDCPVEVDFVSLSRFAPDSGRVRILQDVQLDLTGRDVVLVEAMVDTGLTLAYLRRHLESHGPARVRVCALLDRQSTRIVPQAVDYRGLDPGDVWILGYGFHQGQWYANLPALYRVRRDDLASDPARYISQLYGRAATDLAKH